MEDMTTTARKPRTPWTRDDEAALRDLTGENRTDAEIADVHAVTSWTKDQLKSLPEHRDR